MSADDRRTVPHGYAMRRRASRCTMVLTSLHLIACASGDGECASCDSAAPPLDPMPLATALDLEGCKGRIVVLNFWATWCGPCAVETPAFVKLRRWFAHRDVAIIGVSTAEFMTGSKLRTSLRSFIQRYHINYPMYLENGSNGFVSQNNPQICTIIQIQQPDLHDDTWRQISAPCRVGFPVPGKPRFVIRAKSVS